MMSTPGAILLVEDDGNLGTILSRYLRAKGYEILLATSAEDAEARLEAGLRPRLILLDINLPGKTGWSFLRGAAYHAAQTPAVAILSAMQVSASRLHEFQVAGYLAKPFAMETLVAFIVRQMADTAPPADDSAEAKDLEWLSGGEHADHDVGKPKAQVAPR